MNLLADENVDADIVAWLREEGHDVVWAAEKARRMSDSALLKLARSENRIMLTFDLDFGELIYRQGELSFGLLLMRFRAKLQKDRLRLLQRHWPAIESHLAGSYVVVSSRKIRVRPLP